MTKEATELFANNWIDSWSSHDINAIVEHYTEEIEFHSPLILLLKFNELGIITNKNKLEKYFKIGLIAYPDLTFKLHNVFFCDNTLVLYYTSVNGHSSAEVFHLNENSKALKVFCNYSNNL